MAVPMEKLTLNVEDLAVESFSAQSGYVLIGLNGDCTGCDSGCGIAGPIYSEHYC